MFSEFSHSYRNGSKGLGPLEKKSKSVQRGTWNAARSTRVLTLTYLVRVWVLGFGVLAFNAVKMQRFSLVISTRHRLPNWFGVWGLGFGFGVLGLGVEF
jgi:hypothetical protein